MSTSFFDFPKWAFPLLGGNPPPDPKAPDSVSQPEPIAPVVKRGRGRPPGAKNGSNTVDLNRAPGEPARRHRAKVKA